MDRVLEVVEKVVTDEMAHMVIQPYTEEEVRAALFSMHPSNAPGPDVCLLSSSKNFGIL